MNRTILEKGSHYVLPMINEAITHITFSAHLLLCCGSYELRINHYFMWEQYNYKKVIDIWEKEAWSKMFDILFKKVVNATFDKEGNIHLEFDNGVCIEINELCKIEYNPHQEYWHFIDDGKISAYESCGKAIILR